VNPSDVQRQLDELTAWPVVDTVSAAFVMNAGGRAPSLDQLMDFVSRDPWLTAQVLVAANKIERDDLVAIEDPNIAISLLGDLKLNELAKAMPIVEERAFYFPPITWAHFWMFQIGVARVARFSCQYLEFGDLLPNAYTAGLLHDLGKMLLAKFYPYGFQASIAYAKQRSVPLGEAEKKYIGWSSRELADHFGRKHGLPRLFSNVIQNVDTPHQTEEDADMTALIALSRHLCLKNHVGYSGNGLKDATLPLAETPAWEVLQRRVFPSFNLKLFEAKAHTYCEELKQELTGAVR
jgi:HD-like signal output (HDOD) protein